MSSNKLTDRAWRMFEAGEDLKSVQARTRLSVAVLTGMMHDIERQRRDHTGPRPDRTEGRR